jgi:hypothetical protein
MKIYLTVDFFLQDWIGNPDGVFWMCIQPHIRLSDPGAKLADFIDHIDEFRSFEYALWNRNETHDGVIPVPFPSNANLFLDFLPTPAGHTTLDNLRGAAVKIKKEDWVKLQQANSDPGDTLSGKNKRKEVEIPTASSIPFAEAYNKSLVKAWQDFQAETINTPGFNPVMCMDQMLQAAFWGGTQWRIPANMQIENLHDVDLMTLPNLPDSPAGTLQLTTNLHSLTGLVFRICKRSEAGAFSGITDLRLRLEDGQANPIILLFSNFSWASSTIGAFFSTLTQDPPDGQVTSVWREKHQQRVYVSNALTVFVPQRIDEIVWFRLSKKEQAEGTDHLGQNVRALVVRPNSTATNMPEKLTLIPHDAFEVSLARYRDARPHPDGRTLLQLKPKLSQSSLFYDEVKAHGDPMAWLTGPDRPKFVDTKGKSLDLRPVGVYEFDWDAENLTILFFGSPPEGEQATMIVRRKPSVPIEATLKGVDSDKDPFGLRYEVMSPQGIGGFRFDMLEIGSEASGELKKKLVPSVSFAENYHFEPAQSVTNVEGVVEVRYSKPTDPSGPNNIDAAQEYLHDLLNYNAFNAFAQYETESEPSHLNPRTELYPIFKRKPTPDDAHYIHYFQFRYTQKMLPEAGESAPDFFASLYAKLGTNSALSFNIEHTYGFTKVLESKGRGRGAVTWRPILPTELTLANKEEAKLKKDNLHFCTAVLNEGPPEEIFLQFDPEWIKPEWVQNEKLRPFYLAAWRSIAELANARQIFVTGRFLRFNFHRALAKPSKNGELAAGLEPVREFDPWRLDVTQELRNKCRKWLREGVIKSDDATQRFDAKAPISISQNCLVVELSLEVQRDLGVLPIASEEATFVRAVAPFALDEEGQVMESVPKEQVADAYNRWRNDLLVRTKPITPALSNEVAARSDELRKVLGRIDSSDDLGAWFAPMGVVNPSQRAVPSLCPIAFRPVAVDPVLRASTYQALTMYTWAIDILLRAAVKEGSSFETEQWQSYFRKLIDQKQKLQALIRKIRDLAEPVPNLMAQTLDDEVKASASELASPTSTLRRAWLKWLEQEIWAAPAIFGDAKAFLYTRLRGSVTSAPPPPELVRLNSTKLLRDGNGATSTLTTTDLDRFLIWESLRELADSPLFGFAETLDELRYRTKFTLQELTLSSLEGLLQNVNRPNASSEPAQIELQSGRVHLPIGLFPPGAGAEVRLPAHQPLTSPVHHFSGKIEECQRKDELTRKITPNNIPTPLRLDDLLRGKVTIHQARDEVRVVDLLKSTVSFVRTSPTEAYVLSAIFSIRGNEEFNTEWFEAFATDRFYFNRTNVPVPGGVALSSSSGSDFVKELLSVPHPDILSKLYDTALSNEQLDYFINKLTPAEPPSFELLQSVIKQPFLSIEADGSNVTLLFEQPNKEIQVIEAFLFNVRQANEDVSKPASPSFLLLVNFEVPIWGAYAMSIRQTRNLLDTTGTVKPDISHIFAAVSGEVASDGLFQPVIVRDLSADFRTGEKPPFKLSRQNYSVADIVTRLLVDDYLPLQKTSSEWKASELSVTFHARQRLVTWGAFFDSDSDAVVKDRQLIDHSNLPEINLRFPIGSDLTQPKNWFAPDISEYWVEFQWSSSTNLPFFRLSGIAVQVD